MNLFLDAWHYLSDGANWGGPTGIETRIAQHLWYSLLAIGLSAVIALPIGLLVGHSHRGAAAIVGFANAMRALPTLGVLTFVVLLMGLGLFPRSWRWSPSAFRPCWRGPTPVSPMSIPASWTPPAPWV